MAPPPRSGPGGRYAALFNASGRRVSIENCKGGPQIASGYESVPSFNPDGSLHCPWNWFRTSTDIQPSWAKVLYNLASTTKFQDLEKPLAGRGCWAYPDIMEVGNLATFEEDRAHFGAWVPQGRVVSRVYASGNSGRRSCAESRNQNRGTEVP